MEQAVWKRGAAGILSWSSTRLNPLADAPDQIAWQSVPEKDGPDGEKTTFAFILSAREGKALSDRCAAQTPDRGAARGAERRSPLRARIVVESSVLPEKKTAMVEARIPGTDPSLPEIVLTSHLQEEKFSANDNQSGVANMLEIGRALTRLIARGQARRGRAAASGSGGATRSTPSTATSPTTRARRRRSSPTSTRTWSARSSRSGPRTQFMARTPWSRPSYLSDVAGEHPRRGRRGKQRLPARLAGRLHPARRRPSRSRSSRASGPASPSTREAVPYFDSTDHLVFNDSWVGVPGTTLTNWPDENIHSSGDDLWQIDPTQLKRNAFIVAATAWWLANAGAATSRCSRPSSPRAALERLGRDLGDGRRPGSRPATGTDEDRRRAAADLLDWRSPKEIAAVGRLARRRRRRGGSEDAAARERDRRDAARRRAWLSGERLGDAAGRARLRDAERLAQRTPRLAAHDPRRLDGARARVAEKRHGRAPRAGARRRSGRGAPQGRQDARQGQGAAPTIRTDRDLSPLMAMRGDELDRRQDQRRDDRAPRLRRGALGGLVVLRRGDARAGREVLRDAGKDGLISW